MKFIIKNKPLLNSMNMQAKTYQESFSLFLERTDEKKILLERLNIIIENIEKGSFLDIGAGDGSLTISLSRRFSNSLAVEPNPVFVKTLELKGIKTLPTKWEDVNLGLKKFDFILTAYVADLFPLTRLNELILKIFQSLKIGGTMVLFAVDDSKGDWRTLHTQFYSWIGKHHNSSLGLLKQILCSLGAKHEVFETKIIPKNSNEISKILYFVLAHRSNQFEVNKLKFEQLASGLFESRGGYLNVVHHQFVLIRKK